MSSANAGNLIESSGTSRATLTTDDSKNRQKDPIDYGHVEGQWNPEEWQTSVAPRRDVVYARALEAQMDVVRQLGLKKVEMKTGLSYDSVT